MAEKINKQAVIKAIQNDPTLLDSPEFKSVLVRYQKIHSGPLPPAEDVALYAKSIPDGGDRIMKMAEKSLEIAEAREKAAIDAAKENISIQSRGQWFAIIAVCIFSALAFYIAYLGDTTTAAVLMGTGLVGIVGAFLYDRHNKRD